VSSHSLALRVRLLGYFASLLTPVFLNLAYFYSFPPPILSLVYSDSPNNPSSFLVSVIWALQPCAVLCCVSLIHPSAWSLSYVANSPLLSGTIPPLGDTKLTQLYAISRSSIICFCKVTTFSATILIVRICQIVTKVLNRGNLSELDWESLESGKFVRPGLGKFWDRGKFVRIWLGRKVLTHFSLLAKICPNNHPYYF
jgi:hypothetical protein